MTIRTYGKWGRVGGYDGVGLSGSDAPAGICPWNRNIVRKLDWEHVQDAGRVRGIPGAGVTSSRTHQRRGRIMNITLPRTNEKPAPEDPTVILELVQPEASVPGFRTPQEALACCVAVS